MALLTMTETVTSQSSVESRPISIGGTNHASVAGICGYLGLTAAATAVLYWLLRQFTPSTVPFADGLTTALFLTAQYMMSRKLVQNWWFWITGDVLVIGLYTYKHLYLTSVLYAVFLVMCILGLVEWQRATRKRARRQRVLSNFDASPFVKQRARRPGHQPLVISTDDEGAVATEAEWRDPDKVSPCHAASRRSHDARRSLLFICISQTQT